MLSGWWCCVFPAVVRQTISDQGDEINVSRRDRTLFLLAYKMTIKIKKIKKRKKRKKRRKKKKKKKKKKKI